MGLNNEKSMLHDEISLLKSQLMQMKEKVSEEMHSKRHLENVIMKERKLQHRTMMEFEKMETLNAKLKTEVN